MTGIKILIVEDEPLIAKNIGMYLNNNDFEVSAIAYDADDALIQLKRNPPDFAILDINLEGEKDGIHLGEYINQHYNIPFVFLTSYSDKETLERAKQTNPYGYIVKPFNDKTLFATIEIALSNHAQQNNRHVPALVFEKINRQLVTSLSEREFDVIKLLYEGKTNQQIAGILFIAMNTLKKHINNAYFKLDVTSRTSAIAKLREYMLK
ncbi:MAG TPA: response regulator transcription factor [Chitinophagaceae bacterium]|nr:response regulator transcription factor [Chitinophagaceae bacterium]HNU13762.1 response regulator transcription factor [Chitinophagaceae bacterium]